MGGVDDVVIEGDVSGRLLARMGSSRGVLPFFEDVLSSQSGNTMHFRKVPKELISKKMRDALIWFSSKNLGIVVGVRQENGELLVNPKDHSLKEGESLLMIVDVNSIG